MKLKKFNEFINEGCEFQNESGVYGEVLFHSLPESIMFAFSESLNEGRINISKDDLLLEWGFKDLFKKGAQVSSDKAYRNGWDKESYKKHISEFSATATPEDIIKWGVSAKKAEIQEDVWNIINKLLEDFVEVCDKLIKKEEEISTGIKKKMSETKDAIEAFSKRVKDALVEISEKSKNAVTDVINATKVIIAKLAEVSKNAMVNIGKGVCVGVALPFVLSYSLCKSVVSVCEKLCEKAKEIWPQVKETIDAMKKGVENWVANQLNTIKEKLIELGGNVKELSDRVVKSVTKAYLYVVGVCGLMVDKTSTTIKNAFDKFVECSKSFATEIKDYITDRWEKVSDWTKQTAGDFAEGVKNVWGAFKEKVHRAVEVTAKGVERLKEYAGEKIEDLENWTDSKKKSFTKSILDMAVEKWGAEEVKAWIG